MTEFKQRDVIVSYLAQGNPKNQALVWVSAGIYDLTRYKVLLNVLAKKYYLIAIDLPGTGTTYFPNGLNNPDAMANAIAAMLQNLKVADPIVMGDSAGGNTAIALADKIKPRAIILVGTGEYLSFFVRTLYSMICSPLLISKKMRRFCEYLYHKVGIWRNNIHTDKQLKCIARRWYLTIWQKLPDRISQLPALIIESQDDHIVNKASKRKLKEIYPNHTVVEFHCKHRNYMRTLRDERYHLIIEFIDKLT